MRSDRVDTDLLSRVAHLRMRSLALVDGYLAGVHRSPRRGVGTSFVDHRDYAPGDDPRLLDWRAFARNDRHVIRRFERESQRTAHVALDVSGSMHFGDGATRKLDYATTLLCAVGYILLRQGDAVGASLFDHTIRAHLPARQQFSHFETLLTTLGSGGDHRAPTSMPGALEALTEHLPPRRTLIIASDLLDLTDGALKHLSALRAMRHEVIILHVVHAAELGLVIEGPVRVIGMEDEPALDIDASAVRDAYQVEVAAWLTDCERACRDAGAHYVRAPTHTPGEIVLTEALLETARRGWG